MLGIRSGKDRVISRPSLRGRLGSQVRVGLRSGFTGYGEIRVELTLMFLRIGEKPSGSVRVSTRAGLIQSVISVETLVKICTFLVIEGMNQETFELYYP
jgi:hypothetical protein